MPQQPFRLVHSSDWELQRPLLGWSSAPEALRERLLEAPFVAAERVVETAVREQANFLLLTGGLAPLEEADARTIQFLAAQFERLARERIDVYWVGGPQDPPAAWPSGLPLPSNVHVFGVGEASEQTIRVDGKPAARLVGYSARPGGIEWQSLAGRAGELPTIAAAWGRPRPADVPQDVQYWALGGRSRFSGEQPKSPLRYCGSPQGRGPQDAGVHGCTVVHVSAAGKFQVRSAPCDAVRWRSVRIKLGERAGQSELEAALREQLRALRDEAKEVDQIVEVEVDGAAPLARKLRRPGFGDQLAASVNRDQAEKTTGVWCAAVRAAAVEEWPESLLSQQTMLGDYLREVSDALQDDEPPFDLAAAAESLTPIHINSDRIALADARRRRGVLARAAALGLDLLQKEEATT